MVLHASAIVWLYLWTVVHPPSQCPSVCLASVCQPQGIGASIGQVALPLLGQVCIIIIQGQHGTHVRDPLLGYPLLWKCTTYAISGPQYRKLSPIFVTKPAPTHFF